MVHPPEGELREWILERLPGMEIALKDMVVHGRIKDVRSVLYVALGKGGRGFVSRIREPLDEIGYAVKTPRYQSENREWLLRERAMLERAVFAPRVHVLSPAADQYLLMDYVPGGTLRDIAEDLRSVTLKTRTEIARKFAEGLGCLHEEGKIIHRDLKPVNVLLTTDGNPVFLDFDLAVDMSREDEHSQHFVGTTDFAAPEQFRGYTHRAADVFSLGMTFYASFFAGMNDIGDALQDASGTQYPYFVLSDDEAQGIVHDTIDRRVSDRSWNDLLKRMLAVDRRRRISAQEAERTLHGMSRSDGEEYAGAMKSLFA